MPRILFIDDEPINYQLVAHALESLQCELFYSENGSDGIAKARAYKPDLIITDVMMPEVNGYEVASTLRREVQFASTPILVLTAQSGLQDKLKSFEAGADDHLTKPFDGPELAARVTALLRRAEVAHKSHPETPAQEGARMIAVHSLRGGTGCSSLAVNLGVGLAGLWKLPTVLLDLTMTAGQVALMLNMALRRTWADIARFSLGELDGALVSSIVGAHESGLSFVAAPTFPSEAEMLKPEALGIAIQILKSQYDYVIADLPHDFSAPAIQALDLADMILLVASPEMASVRAVTAALDTYAKIGYPKEKIKLILSATFSQSGLSKDKIEAALGMTTFATIPYTQNVFVDAINFGQPILMSHPEIPVSCLLEDLAFHLSKDTHKKSKPQTPTEAWTRVYKRYQSRKK